MKHLISYYENVLAFLIKERKEQENRRFVLESNLNRKGYYFDIPYLKSEISKCHANEDYYNFVINIINEQYKEILEKYKRSNCCEQVTIS